MGNINCEILLNPRQVLNLSDILERHHNPFLGRQEGRPAIDIFLAEQDLPRPHFFLVLDPAH